jgi:hypothetical protein
MIYVADEVKDGAFAEFTNLSLRMMPVRVNPLVIPY